MSDQAAVIAAAIALVADRLNTEIVGHTDDHHGGRLNRATAESLAHMAVCELLTNGYALVDLPKPDPDIGPYFDAGNGAIAHADGERVRLHSVAWTEGRHGGTWFTPAQARSTAAALLAAADEVLGRSFNLT